MGGILAEPATRWHDLLTSHPRCVIDTRCIWNRSRELITFYEASEAEYSTMVALAEGDDGHRHRRISSTHYDVETVSLNDLLEEHSAPRTIDYLSIDTEGSEFEILQAFDFSSWDVRVLTVEHNHNQARRAQIFELLTEQGFVRVFEKISAFDDWYLHQEPANTAEAFGLIPP